ncbi:MAG TPA: hypothetical protein VHL57_01970 [Flavobacteriales bacterium]|jgi:hypothetical protein|nr:hypothetical protein [Flavobacteriales bacterium]
MIHPSPTPKLEYAGTLTRLKKCVAQANAVLADPMFRKLILEHSAFDNTKFTNLEVYTYLANNPTVVQVITFKKLFGRVNGRTSSAKRIGINSKRLDRSLASIVNTIIHEYVHAVDFGLKKSPKDPLQMTHYNNENNGEEDNTVPWAVGLIAQRMSAETVSTLRNLQLKQEKKEGLKRTARASAR